MEILFKNGDVVQLKSGGPKMTVTKIIGSDTSKTENFGYKTIAGHKTGDVVCQWFDDIEMKEGVFDPNTIEIA